MPVFRIDAFNERPHDYPLWNLALKDSFERINGYDMPIRKVLDSAGGAGWMMGVMDPSVEYHLLDLNASRIEAAPADHKQVGSSEAMPFEDDSFDLVVSVSAAQYMDKEKLLSECWRVLRPGGLLALHENGAHNPIISMLRVYRRQVLSRRSGAWKAYDDTIQGYLTPEMVKAFGFEWLHHKPRYLFSAGTGLMDYLKWFEAAKTARKVLLPMDDVLMKAPGIRELGFMNVFHLRKPLEH